MLRLVEIAPVRVRLPPNLIVLLAAVLVIFTLEPNNWPWNSTPCWELVILTAPELVIPPTLPVKVTGPPAFTMVNPPAVLSTEATVMVAPVVVPELRLNALLLVLTALRVMVADDELPESMEASLIRLILRLELPRFIGAPEDFKEPANPTVPEPAVAVTPLVKVVRLVAFLPKETPARLVKVVAESIVVLFWKLTA